MTNDNKPQDVSTNPCKDLPEGVTVFDHTKYNKDQKLRMMLSVFSQGLKRIGDLCQAVISEHDREDPIDPSELATKILIGVDHIGQHGIAITGSNDPDFDDDDVTGSGKRKYIPVSEIKKVLTDHYRSGYGQGDDVANETVDSCLEGLGFDTSKDGDVH